MSNITLEDACKFKHLDKLTPDTREAMVNAPSYVQEKLQTAFAESFNTNLMSASRTLRSAGFSDKQAIEVIYCAPAHRPSDGVEIERAVERAYDTTTEAEVGNSKSRWWQPAEVSTKDIRANLIQAGIVAMSRGDMLEHLADSPEEADNPTDFVRHFFNGVDAPVYIGNRWHGIIEDVANWVQMSEIIEGERYDQVLANPMKRKLTADELRETHIVNGKERLKYASGGRCKELASDDMQVITFESDKLTPEEQFAVIAYLAQYLPLVSIVYSGGDSYHATFSLKGMTYEQVLDLRVALVAIGGDPSVMSPYQLVRLGGVHRSDNSNKLQEVLWIDPDARMSSVEADKLAELLGDTEKDLEIYYYKDRYWMLDDSGEKYISLTDSNMTRRLRMLGYSYKAGDDGSPSAVDRIKDNAIFTNTIDFASPVAGRSIGLQTDSNGMRFLISSKNKRANAVEGDWSTIQGIVEGMLKDQAVYFYSWLKVARKQLETEQFTQGHVLALAGATNCGKSLTASTIIKPLLGRSADPTKYLTTDSNFNANLVTSELLIMDDKAQRRTAEAKTYLAHSLKDISASSYEVDCEPKGVDPFQVHPLWRMLYILNDDDAALCAFPPLGEGDCNSIGDKVLLLKCWNDVPLPFTGHHHQSIMLKRAIESEVEAFAYYIDNFNPPGSIKTGHCRFGFDEFHHSDLLEVINQDSNERTLLSATDEIFFGKDSIVPEKLCPTTQRTYWTGTASDWSEILRAEKHHGASKTINGELSYGSTSKKAGKVLARMAKVSDGRVIKDDSRTSRGWRIWSPQEESDVDGDPF